MSARTSSKPIVANVRATDVRCNVVVPNRMIQICVVVENSSSQSVVMTT
jgi:hypothetical protein